MTHIYIELRASSAWDHLAQSSYRDQWTYEGFAALFKIMETYAEVMGEPMELDLIAWSSEFAEQTALEIMQDYYEDELEELKDEAEPEDEIEELAFDFVKELCDKGDERIVAEVKQSKERNTFIVDINR